MWNTIINAPWYQFYNVLADGNPPMIFKLLALNTVVFILFIVRRAKGVHTMPSRTAIAVQSLLLMANGLILFQDEIQASLSRIL
ncbi:hypothetical protein [Aestuariivirga sp.]|uniref:hypothetical protein n=1 Tax=Aestuariivirga sp. TaxID=2650926 RepID=UPI0039E41628